MKFHRHRCDQCNVTWRHATTEANARNHHAHMCPKCGDMVTEVLIPDKNPKSIRGVRRILRRALAHALASGLKNVVYTRFTNSDDPLLVSSHGIIEVTMRYPYKPGRKMPRHD